MQVIQRKPYDNFVQACKSVETRREYTAGLKRFLIHYKIGDWETLEKLQLEESETLLRKSCEELLKLEPRQLEDTLIDYIVYMKDKKRSQGLITQQIASIRKFLITNRVNLNWEYINQYKGEFRRAQTDEAYTHDQIQKLLDISNIRTRALVLIFSSTGTRVGALPDLKRRHLKRLGDIYQFTFYEGYPQQYVTFCTPECAKAIDDYFAYRERSGEILTEESYVIRKEFDSNDLQQVRRNSQPMAKSTIRGIMLKLMLTAGIRRIKKGVDTTHRKQVQELHGFRKFFSSQLVNTNINTEKRWLLEGHNLKANDNSYVKVWKELHDEYIKAIDNLTISPENRQKKQIIQLKEDTNQIELLKIRMQEKDEQILALETRIENSWDTFIERSREESRRKARESQAYIDRLFEKIRIRQAEEKKTRKPSLIKKIRIAVESGDTSKLRELSKAN